MINLKRIYEPAEKSDGYRVLVDRLWPRGVGKTEADLDKWLKEVAPSPELRVWFNHQADRFAEFKARYEDELASNPAIKELEQITKDEPVVTLVYAAKDPAINHVVVLRDFIKGA